MMMQIWQKVRDKMTALKNLLVAGTVYAAYRGAKKALDSTVDQADYMARTIYGEARGEGSRGMQAVANVIMNRVKRGGWYGASVKDVVLKPYQFSCWNDGDPNKAIITQASQSQLKTARSIAEKVMSGELPDITSGATHYYANTIAKPYWAKTMTKTASIGNHYFYA